MKKLLLILFCVSTVQLAYGVVNVCANKYIYDNNAAQEICKNSCWWATDNNNNHLWLTNNGQWWPVQHNVCEKNAMCQCN